MILPPTEYVVVKGDIPGYFNDTTMAQMSMWEMYKLFGFPYSGGYDEQPAVYMDIIQALETECAKRNRKPDGQ